METAKILFSQVIIMFLLIIVGFVCYRLKLISHETNKQMSNLLITIINSAMILNTFQLDYSTNLTKNLAIFFVLSFITLIIGTLVSNIMKFGSGSDSTKATERFAIIFPNSGYMGIPLLISTIGQTGVFYSSAFIIAFNIFSWTKGVMLLTGKNDKKLLLTALTSPVIISIFIGLPMFLLQIKLPNVIASAIGYVADLYTPLSMIIAGCFIAQTNLKKAFSTARVYFNGFIKLIIIPLIMILLLSVLPLENELRLSMMILAATPTAASTMLFSSRFGGDVNIAGSLFSVSTIFCIATIPLMTMVAAMIWL